MLGVKLLSSLFIGVRPQWVLSLEPRSLANKAIHRLPLQESERFGAR